MTRLYGALVGCLAALATACASPSAPTLEPAPASTHPAPSTVVTPALLGAHLDEHAPYNATADLSRAGMLAEGAADSGEVTITFDDGPGVATTSEVLRILAAHHVRAAFFLSGSRLAGDGVVARADREIARAIVDAGHVVGNHALDHLPLDRGEPTFCAFQIEEAARLVEEATGVKPRYFRPPYGVLGEAGRAVVEARGDELVLWTIGGQDVDEHDPDKIMRRWVDQLLFAGQGLVLVHDLRDGSVHALARFLDWLDRHPAFVVVDLPSYLAHAAAHPYPYPDRLHLLRARQRAHGVL